MQRAPSECLLHFAHALPDRHAELVKVVTEGIQEDVVTATATATSMLVVALAGIARRRGGVHAFITAARISTCGTSMWPLRCCCRCRNAASAVALMLLMMMLAMAGHDVRRVLTLQATGPDLPGYRRARAAPLRI